MCTHRPKAISIFKKEKTLLCHIGQIHLACSNLNIKMIYNNLGNIKALFNLLVCCCSNLAL